MRYELRLTAYDVMDQVWVSMSLHQSPDTPGQPSAPLLHWIGQAQGTGESDPRQWAIDALLTAVEEV